MTLATVMIKIRPYWVHFMFMHHCVRKTKIIQVTCLSFIRYSFLVLVNSGLKELSEYSSFYIFYISLLTCWSLQLLIQEKMLCIQTLSVKLIQCKLYRFIIWISDQRINLQKIRTCTEVIHINSLDIIFVWNHVNILTINSSAKCLKIPRITFVLMTFDIL